MNESSDALSRAFDGVELTKSFVSPAGSVRRYVCQSGAETLKGPLGGTTHRSVIEIVNLATRFHENGPYRDSFAKSPLPREFARGARVTIVFDELAGVN